MSAPEADVAGSSPRPVIAIFGPTGIGKTGVVIELAELLRARGSRPVAVNCDAIQVYSGLEVLSGVASAEENARLEHRLTGFVPVDEEFSAGRYGERAHQEIDRCLAEGRQPIVVGGTGLYLRAALTDLDFRPSVPDALRKEVESELEERGPEAMHATLPPEFRDSIHPNDRKRIARTIELIRDGQAPAPDHKGGGELWTADLRQPTLLFGLVDDDDALVERIDRRVEAMAACDAAGEVKRAIAGNASRTARAAIGFSEFLEGDLDRVKLLHRRYGRRQMTWMRRMAGVEVVEREGRSDEAVAQAILDRIDLDSGRNAAGRSYG
ncbi:MAG: tRNA (adenosine(37)-N6)-dimethylallyltransferase MiaA [Thermoleophilia bacterium]|nr:tRNA (adenosine(37)-N6)-dimethylallyltransferase MiaA [Thermoleophilia bacterium]